MRDIYIFAEDDGHDRFLTALIARFAAHYGVEYRLIKRAVSGGHGVVLAELRRFIQDLQRRPGSLPDLLIIAIDGNCKGFVARKREIDDIAGTLGAFTIYAIPDPHIERWLLLDSAAFKSVLGKGCAAPDQKCERDRYKRLLRAAVRDAGQIPRLGGIEFTQPLVRAIDLQRVSRQDAGLERLIAGLRDHFAQWTGKPAIIPGVIGDTRDSDE